MPFITIDEVIAETNAYKCGKFSTLKSIILTEICKKNESSGTKVIEIFYDKEYINSKYFNLPSKTDAIAFAAFFKRLADRIEE